jgi:hypothetical protein
MAPQRKGIKHEYMRDRGGPPAAWQGPCKNNPEPQDSPYGYVRSRPSTMHFKLIVDD